MFVFIENGYSSKISGGDRHAHTVINHLVQHGYRVETILPRGVFFDEYLPNVTRVTYHRFKIEDGFYRSRTTLFLLYIYRVVISSVLLRRSKALRVVASSHLFHDVWPMLFAKKGCRLYVYVHHVLSLQQRRGVSGAIVTLLEKLSFYIIKLVNATIISVSPAVSGQLQKDFGFPPEYVRTSSNAIDVHGHDASKSIKERDIDVLFCGRLHEKKGVFDFIKIVKLLRSRRHRMTVLMIGTGPEYEVISSMVVGDEALSGVRMTGFVSEIEKRLYISRAKILVLPSHEEGWSIVTAEALASGVPVVASDLEEMRSVWSDMVTWVGLGRITEYVSAVNALLDDEVLWSQKSKAGLEFVGRYDNSVVWSKEAEHLLTSL